MTNDQHRRSDGASVGFQGMFNRHWKSCLAFAFLITVLDIVVVQYGVDFQSRGYLFPFLQIATGWWSWHIPNLLLTVLLATVIAVLSLGASCLPINVKQWVCAALGTILISWGTAWCLWRGIESPITQKEMMDQAVTVANAIRHVLTIGTLLCFGCLFAAKLKSSECQKEDVCSS